jgi:hypothetical protein
MMNSVPMADAKTPAEAAPAAARAAPSPAADAATSNDETNPLWLLVAGMALFFVVAAGLLAAS